MFIEVLQVMLRCSQEFVGVLWDAFLKTNHSWIYLLIIETEEKRERNIDVREKYQWASSHMHLEEYRTRNLGKYPEQQSNSQGFGVWGDAAIN